MKKEQREVYHVLAAEVDAGLGAFCKYLRGSGSCCDGGLECIHPLEYVVPHFDDCECECPGTDCWGFRSKFTMADIADIVGVVLSEGYLDWMYRVDANGQILVSGEKKREPVPVSPKTNES